MWVTRFRLIFFREGDRQVSICKDTVIDRSQPMLAAESAEDLLTLFGLPDIEPITSIPFPMSRILMFSLEVVVKQRSEPTRGMIWIVMLTVMIGAISTPSWAQRVRIPTITAQAPTTVPPTTPGVTLGQPIPGGLPFDAYGTGSSGTVTPPLPPVSPPSSLTTPPAPGQPFYPQTGQPYGWPTSPPSIFPNGVQPPDFSPYAPDLSRFSFPSLRRLENFYLRHTWLAGDLGKKDIDINTTELAVSAKFPNFLHSPQPLIITPGFNLHLLSGPLSPSPPHEDDNLELPGQLYEAFGDLSWNPCYTPQLGAEIDVRVGVFTDFNTLTTDSVRILGTGLGVIQVTPSMSLKLGVQYLDRAQVKMLPAGGVVWKPNEKTRFDIFFPKPKLAQYLVTVGNTDFWWYVGGEYGGGSWTFERMDGTNERVDINDIRLYLGLEWTTTLGPTGLFEAGYVMDRELVYVNDPPFDQNLNDTFMLRAGLVF